MGKITELGNAYIKPYKPRVASQSYEKLQRLKMLERMGVAPSGRVSPAKGSFENLRPIPNALSQ
jgi:hypothetical protein